MVMHSPPTEGCKNSLTGFMYVENHSTYLSFRSNKNIPFQGTSHDPNMFRTTNTINNISKSDQDLDLLVESTYTKVTFHW